MEHTIASAGGDEETIDTELSFAEEQRSLLREIEDIIAEHDGDADDE